MTDATSNTLSDFNYDLPAEYIAQYPLENRSESRLLNYENGTIAHLRFTDLPHLLPSGSLMIFNDTKVFPARTFFQKTSGAVIQVFLMNAIGADIQQAMSSLNQVRWECIIGNLKKWKDGEILSTHVSVNGKTYEVRAKLTDRTNKAVEFDWDGDLSFSSIISALGHIPLPPYIKRETEDIDIDHYQTIYAKNEGAVAAPTAGLHFTDPVLEQIRARNITLEYLTLHVGAGTFQPMQSQNVTEHNMHSEQFEVNTSTIRSLLTHKTRIAVGTTTLRTLESLYWAGVKASRQEDPSFVEKLYPYENPSDLSYEVALENLENWLKIQDLSSFRGRTAIMIMPSYRIRSIRSLVTNFHLPQSTLIMLVAAFVGENWKKIYAQAIDHSYRFLSYGDSSLLTVDSPD